MKPPTPLCKAFLVCSRVVEQEGEFSLVRLARRAICRFYPAAQPLGVFARCTSSHGDYQVELQLQTMQGDVVWRDGPPEVWPMPDPLEEYDLNFNLSVVFPKPGTYEIVLMANGEEVGRQKFIADVAPQLAER